MQDYMALSYCRIIEDPQTTIDMFEFFCFIKTPVFEHIEVLESHKFLERDAEINMKCLKYTFHVKKNENGVVSPFFYFEDRIPVEDMYYQDNGIYVHIDMIAPRIWINNQEGRVEIKSNGTLCGVGKAIKSDVRTSIASYSKLEFESLIS